MEKFRIVVYYHMYSYRVDGIPNPWFQENVKGIGHFRVPKTHFRNEANCKTFLEKMSFICMKITNTFYINGFALSLALKQRLGATQK